MVVGNFMRLHVAPLQVRKKPTWLLEGNNDPKHLHRATIGNEGLTWIMETLFHSDVIPVLPPSIGMLHTNMEHDAILRRLPECNKWGVVPTGQAGTDRPNPFLRWASSPGLNYGVDVEEDEEDGENDSGGSSSVPVRRKAPPPQGQKHAPPPLTILGTVAGA